MVLFYGKRVISYARKISSFCLYDLLVVTGLAIPYLIIICCNNSLVLYVIVYCNECIVL
jgi:hypothetical protein